MQPHDERNRRIDALRELMERLDSPDLTLAEAKGLRSRLDDLLEPEGPPQTGAQDRQTRSGGGQGWRDALRQTLFSPCAVG